MLMGNRTMIQQECDRRNAVRRVRGGSVDRGTFFRKVRGDLLISGYVAADTTLLADMVTEYRKRDDLPTVLLSCHRELFELLRQRRSSGVIDRVILSDPRERNYHPFYGMSAQKLLHFIHLTAEAQGYGVCMDRVLQYASAALAIVAASYPISLPALENLLLEDDDAISAYALQKGLSSVVADNIRANHGAGIVVRRVCEKLQTVFEDVSVRDTETKYNFQSGAGRNSVMAFYYVSADQGIMNAYLKEELFFTLKRVPKIRVILDEMEFDGGEEDELLQFLFKMKRQGKIELVFLSQNAREAVGAGGMQMSFPNVVLSGHGEPALTEALSRELWGTYSYNYPVPVAGKPPALIFTFRTMVHWQIATEERSRVRAEDLFGRQGMFGRESDLLAIKTTANDFIFLVPSSQFQKSPV